MATVAVGTLIQIGLQVALIAASIALSLLNRPKGQDTKGPRVEDRSVTTSTYGNAIPRIDGGVRVGANMIWSTDIREVKARKKSGGKGGGSSIHRPVLNRLNRLWSRP